MLLALDPSINSCGVALFKDDRLVAAGVVRHKAVKGTDILARCVAISEGVYNWCVSQGAVIGELVAEWPRVYAAAKSKGSPDDLVPLAAVCGAVAVLVGPCKVSSVFPAEWAGQVTKIETVKGCKQSPRAKKILRRLDANELKVWDTVRYHDTIDAIGIGLHRLGRFERIRVFGKPLGEV